jgi:YndJ-like protein
MRSERFAALAGAVAWALYACFFGPRQPLEQEWVLVLLLAAPLVFVPILLAAVAFALAFCLPQGSLAGGLTLPWLAGALYLLWRQRSQMAAVFQLSPSERSRLAGILGLLVGAAWALADRLAFRPLDFDPTIVILTAAHFHYAGFMLSFGLAFALQNRYDAFAQNLSWAMLLTPALVAVGITSTQLGGPYWLESLAATTMAIAGWAAAWALWRSSIGLRGLRFFAAVCLAAGMVLAFLYAWRFYPVLPWLSIPWMYAIHGTLNSLGLGLYGMAGAWGHKDIDPMAFQTIEKKF